jgi:hypothetical protein
LSAQGGARRPLYVLRLESDPSQQSAGFRPLARDSESTCMNTSNKKLLNLVYLRVQPGEIMICHAIWS